jgi:intracellular septation protein
MTALALPDHLASPPRREPHALVHALRWIAGDLLSTLAFVGVYAVSHDALLATMLAFAAGVAQIISERLRRRPVDAMQILSLALVAVFGAASLLTHDARFIMFKPTIVYAAVGAVMLKPGWMTRYVPEIALRWSADLVVGFGYLWAALMFSTALANAGLAIWAGPRVWSLYIAAFPIGSKVAMVLLQYGVTRAITARRIHAAAKAPA